MSEANLLSASQRITNSRKDNRKQSTQTRTYHFKDISYCEMCGDPVADHRILGQRLNKSQGLHPKSKHGISVSIFRCTNCDLIYSNPQPVPQSIQDHYGLPASDYWKPEYFAIKPGYFKGVINKVKSLIPFENGMKSLDIGAGLGKGMLAMSRSGFDSYGLEPSVPFYEQAIHSMRIPPDRLRCSSIEDANYPPQSFDFITFSAVFEHLYEPANCLKKALQWLKPGGIVHIEVPSSDWFIPHLINLYFKLKGTNYVTHLSPMHAPYHLYEFSLKSFQKLSSQLSVSIEEYRYDVCSVYYIPKLLKPMVRYYMFKTKKGMQLTIYLRKN